MEGLPQVSWSRAARISAIALMYLKLGGRRTVQLRFCAQARVGTRKGLRSTFSALSAGKYDFPSPGQGETDQENPG
jgi:hypothetical protein